MGRPYCKTGDNFVCPICGKEFYRTPGQVRRGATKTCSKGCLGKLKSGSGNPFWNRTHSEETRRKISESRKGKALGNKNGVGYHHTDEARKRIGEASKELWKNHRTKMIESLPRGENHRFHKPPELRRHRKGFTPRQRREWAGKECRYCKNTEDLVLDHVIPIFDGGTNMKENCQTLCRVCNLWKVENVDLPRYYAALASKGA